MLKFFGRLMNAGVAALLPVLAATGAMAYPDRAVHIVVPYAAGGSTDIIARIIAADLAGRLHAAVVIDNKPGAGGNLGAGLVAREPADGYTILFTGAALASSASMKNIPFDPRTAFVPITEGVSSNFSILADPNSAFKTMADVVAYAKAHPGKLDVACSGALTSAHFALEHLKEVGKIDFQIVQFNGNAPANLAVASGTVPVGIDAAFSAKGLVDGGKLRMLAVTSEHRLAFLPDVPTVTEAGVPGYISGFWLGFFARANTPKPVVEQLQAEIADALHNPGVVARLADQGVGPVGNSSQDFARGFSPRSTRTAR